MRKQFILALFPLLFLTLAICHPSVSDAQSRRITIARDAEIESTLKQFAAPIFQAAGLEPSAIDFYVIQDDTLNAFVAGGQNMFINTGLLMRAESANQLIGVMAHETGHIAGGHLARAYEAQRNAAIEQILATVLGAGAAVATRSPGAVTAGSSIGLRSFLAFTRTQEAAADQAAFNYLDATGQSTRGMVEFFGILSQQDGGGRQDPYLRSHPLTKDRVATAQHHLAESALANKPDDPVQEAKFQRIRAKLIGYLRPLNQVLQTYPEKDQSLPARYARAVAYYRAGQTQKALQDFDALIAENPKDPYFLELKGQILFENGRGNEAIPVLQKAVLLAPQAALIRIALAQAQIETEDPALNRLALANLEEALRYEPYNSSAWRHLAVAYGRDGQIGMSALALSEAALARGDADEAIEQADRAQQQLPAGSVGYLRTQDIIAEAQRILRNR